MINAMATVELSTSSIREGFLVIKESTLDLISDQDIIEGDIIHHPLHRRKDNTFMDIHVDEILEERKSRGAWSVTPPVWRRIKYHKI